MEFTSVDVFTFINVHLVNRMKLDMIHLMFSKVETNFVVFFFFHFEYHTAKVKNVPGACGWAQ
jgi:hypothetical protein